MWKNILKMSSEKKYYIEYDGKIFAVDAEALIEYCLKSENKDVQDRELTEGYERLSEDSDELTLTSKVIRENTGVSNPQNDMITYDLIKMFLSIVLSQNDEDTPFNNVSFAIAFNTLVHMGFLIEIIK